MFLSIPPDNDARADLYSRDIADDGYVANLTRLWAWRPDVFDAFTSIRKLLADHATLSLRDRAILVCATAANLKDSYCALAWGKTLASETSAATAAAILQCDEAAALSDRERALVNWTRRVVREPNSIQADDVDALRSAGLGDEEIFNATAFIAFRLAFSTVNDALGAGPDRQVASAAPPEVREAVNYGRSISGDDPRGA